MRGYSKQTSCGNSLLPAKKVLVPVVKTGEKKSSFSSYLRLTSNGIWAAPSEIVPSNTSKMRRFRSSCACATYDLDPMNSFINSVVSNDSVSGN